MVQSFFSYSWRGHRNRLIPNSFVFVSGVCISCQQARVPHKDHNVSHHTYNYDIFSRQIDRERSKEHLVIILAVKESFERFSCLEFIFEKSKYREAGLKHKLKL